MVFEFSEYTARYALAAKDDCGPKVCRYNKYCKEDNRNERRIQQQIHNIKLTLCRNSSYLNKYPFINNMQHFHCFCEYTLFNIIKMISSTIINNKNVVNLRINSISFLMASISFVSFSYISFMPEIRKKDEPKVISLLDAVTW